MPESITLGHTPQAPRPKSRNGALRIVLPYKKGIYPLGKVGHLPLSLGLLKPFSCLSAYRTRHHPYPSVRIYAVYLKVNIFLCDFIFSGYTQQSAAMLVITAQTHKTPVGFCCAQSNEPCPNRVRPIGRGLGLGWN